MKYNSFPDALISKVKTHPDKTFIIEGKKHFTYKQHLAAALSFSDRLSELGVKKGDRVIICTSQTISCLNAFMGSHITGAVIVPVEGKTPPARIREIQKMVNASATIASEAVTNECRFIDISAAELISERYSNNIPFEALPAFPKPDDILSIMFTTGTTGKSKGVVLTVDSQMAVAENACSNIYKEEGKVVLIIPTLSHAFGIRRSQQIMLAGGTVVLLNKLFTPKAFFDEIRNNNVHIVAITPAHITLILNLAEREFREIGNQLEMIDFSGAGIPEPIKEKLVGLLPNTKLVSTYATTEAGAIFFAEFHEMMNKKQCLGRPANSKEVFIGDSNGIPIGIGPDTIGRICITGRTVMKEYYNEPELTNSVLKKGRLITADLGYVDKEGLYYIVGRNDDVIISGAFKISPQEIEDIAIQMPDIEDCACVPVEDEIMGSVPKLFVVMRNNSEFSFKAINDYLAVRLEKALLPRYIEPIEKIPRTSSGKISRYKLKGGIDL